ncbi:acyl-CoA dehydrogenase family protein (plasmid) [Bradyrhizobium sp. 62B]|uniref:acyl-CoA dehydrogenase family protein n=1 Tax=Bradyrhizobium sp. 62B TaxID=2898442 RepID=UPI00255813CC|nr:acyl-CoA dehydrogenase family protein [Bradyrhizobium sp. 62B]WIW50248.1 acyl-CoA dehydrogenase family protein [Bradyrhizobium sp. 62B]
MSTDFRFGSLELPPAAVEARRRIRTFMRDELDAGRYDPQVSSWNTWDEDFTRRAGDAGFIGMVWPKEHGGAGATHLERFVVIEEMLAHSAPCFAHWVADRQTGPQILKFGSERVKRTYLPAMAAGRCYAAIGMSEPNSGSDLASVQTRATPCAGGWRINGTKIWTSGAHRAHILIALVRTSPPGGVRHEGLTQFVIDTSAPGITCRPIYNLCGHHDFNEVHFEDYFVPDDAVLGEVGEGWKLVNHELSFERSGPDRYMSDFRLILNAVDRIGSSPDALQSVEIGRLFAHLSALRRMSAGVAGLLAQGVDPYLEAAIVKDLGTSLEQSVPEITRRLIEAQPSSEDDDEYGRCYTETRLFAPGFTIRGGTREIMRGVIARGLGVR